MTTPAQPDRALLLTTYQIERAADATFVQRNMAVVSLALVYMAAASAFASGDSDVPIGLLLVLPLPAIGLLNLLISSLAVALAHHWYIQELERELSGQPDHIDHSKYRIPYWQRYIDSIEDPRLASPEFKPLAVLWPLMPLGTVIAFATVLLVTAFQRADQFAVYVLCAVAALSYLCLVVLGIRTFWVGLGRIQTDLRA